MKIRMTNSTNSVKSTRPRRFVAGALILSSVLGVMSTPALAEEVEVPYEVTVIESELPPCDGEDYVPYWSPGVVVYDEGASDIGYVDLAYINYLLMTVDFNVSFGMDGNCDSVVPEGYITAAIAETGPNTADDAVIVGCTDVNPCDAQLATDVTARLQFSGPGDYAGNFVLTWVLD